jgi:hypothetical protein
MLVPMKRIPLLTTIAAIGVTGAVLPMEAPDQTTLRQFEGTVVSVNRDARSFRLRDTERGTVTIRVTRRTRFERVAGLAGLRAGMRNIESTVRRSNGRWVASEVERSGGGGEHGGRGGRGGGDDD